MSALLLVDLCRGRALSRPALRPSSPVFRPSSFVPRKKSPANPTEWFAGESEEIPTTVQFSALRAGNGTAVGISELAQRVGFEPTVPLRVHLISRDIK